MNPWKTVPYEDYETHMKDDTVGQLKELSKIIEMNLKQFEPESVLFFGCAGGNGFEHIDDRITKRVIGIDINKKYLELCKKSYGSKDFDLELICCDIDETELELDQVDYISCALILEYVDWQKMIKQVIKLMHEKSIFNIVIQKNNNNQFVSKTNIESLKALSSISKTISEEALETYQNKMGLELADKSRIELPNGKEFISYIYRKN